MIPSLFIAVLVGASVGYGVSDTTPPPVPDNIRVLQLGPTPNRVALQWDGVTDSGGSGLKEYILYRNSREITRNTNPLGVDSYLLPSTTYRFSVAAVDNAGNISQPSADFEVNTLPTPPLPPSLSVLALLVTFPDFPTLPFDASFVEDLVFTENATSVNSYFQEVSYGRTGLTGSVRGWYPMPRPGSNYCTFTLNGGLWYGCNTGELLNDVRSIVPPEVDLNEPDVVLILINGMGTVGLSGGRYKYFSASQIGPSQIIHEIGHSIPGVAIRHAAGLDICAVHPMPPDLNNLTSEGCFLGRYTDGYDPMGAGNTYHFSTFVKSLMGMLEASEIATATVDGRYEIDQLERPSNGTKMLKIPLSDEMFYFLEFRTPVGFDGPGTPSGSSPHPNGVLIRLRVSSFPGTDADTVRPQITLNPGAPFVDPYRGIRVDVVNRNTQSATVEISGMNRPLRIVDIHRDAAGNRTCISFDGVVGAVYDLQGALVLNHWQPVRNNLEATTTPFTICHTNTFPWPHFFYRIKVSQ